MPVNNGDTVRVHYTGTLDDGTQFDTSEGGEPLEFVIGDGQVIPGFEKAVSELEPGQETTVTIDAMDAYGFRRDELKHKVSKSDFAEEPYLGGMVSLVAPDGTEMSAQIVEIGDDDVTLDFNHPLAGQDLTFKVRLEDVVPKPVYEPVPFPGEESAPDEKTDPGEDAPQG